MSFFIYKITNLINSKIYIGKTTDIENRFEQHKNCAIRQTIGNYFYIHRAMNKYGFDKFKIECVGEHSSEEEAFIAEKFFIKYYNSNDRDMGYNLTDGGDGSSGYKHTEESKKIMSEIKKNEYIGEGNPFYGKHHSNETKNIIGKLAKERYKNSMDNPFYGKVHSEESINLMKLHHHKKEKFLSEQDIENIKYRKFTLKQTYKFIAVDYDMHPRSISNAVNGRRAYKKINSTTSTLLEIEKQDE